MPQSVAKSVSESSPAKHFRAVLEPLQGGLGWVVAWLPFEPATAWKKMNRLRVTVEIAGQVFRTSLFSAPAREGHFILVNKKMQRAAGATIGGMVDFTIAPDLDARDPILPPTLERLFTREKQLAMWFAGLSESTRLEICKWIEGVKGPEARERRTMQMAERMMLTMQGEKSPPPILDVAFRKNPAARKGWEAMTLTQRRGHLMGVFYYQTPEARIKRVEKLVEDAVRIAQTNPRLAAPKSH